MHPNNFRCSRCNSCGLHPGEPVKVNRLSARYDMEPGGSWDDTMNARTGRICKFIVT